METIAYILQLLESGADDALAMFGEQAGVAPPGFGGGFGGGSTAGSGDDGVISAQLGASLNNFQPGFLSGLQAPPEPEALPLQFMSGAGVPSPANNIEQSQLVDLLASKKRNTGPLTLRESL